MFNKRLKFLVAENKIGIAKKLVDILTLGNINILKMEINPPYISVEIEGKKNIGLDFGRWIKQEIEEILDVFELDLLDFERRAKELQTVINSMNIGVIAVGKNGEILYYNSKAANLFNIISEENSININKIIPKDIYNPKIDKKNKLGIEFTEKMKNKELNLIIDIKLIKDQQENKTGALFILREMEEVRRLVQSLSRPFMNNFEDIIGKSKSIKDTKLLAKLVAKTNSNVMILGESGTGKELFARAIHLSSNRADGPFVAINCSAVPDSLIESEFFGYEKGAFTGARSSGKQGLFQLATNGTIFLDEIGDLPIHLQAKILRAIQEKKIRRIGGQKEISINVRIISATHRNLQKMVKEETFREDLYYRLNVVPIHIPPLRERKEDIPLLARYFIRTLSEKMGGGSIKEITQEALNELIHYHWPGNVRELENIMERASIFAKDKIQSKHLMIQNKNKEDLQKNFTKDDNKIELPVELYKIIRDIEYVYINEANKKFHSSREVAKALGISHTTVIKKLKQYRL